MHCLLTRLKRGKVLRSRNSIWTVLIIGADIYASRPGKEQLAPDPLTFHHGSSPSIMSVTSFEARSEPKFTDGNRFKR